MATEDVGAGNMKKSSIAVTRVGTSVQPLEPDAVVRSTDAGQASSEKLNCSENTVKALVAFITALLGNTLSGDVIYLAVGEAEHLARDAGVPPEEFKRVMGHIMRFWRRKKAEHPLGSMF